jgi:UDP-sulfoquinovose synthase
VFNQFTEMFSVNELAERVARVAGTLGFACEIAKIENPRFEREEHYYNCVNTNLRSLGLEPTLLSDETIAGLIQLADTYRDRVDLRLIPPRVTWRSDGAGHPRAVAS